MRELISAILICVVLVAAIAVLKESGPITEGRFGEYPLRTLVFEFQTLLTGVLAVAAAYITVLQMRASDQKSDDRHFQTLRASQEQHKASMRLALRGDRLRVHRALHPQFRELKFIRKAMEELEHDTRLIWNSPDSIEIDDGRYSKEVFEALALALYPKIAEVKSLLGRSQMQEGAKLFDGDLTFRIDELVQLVDRTEDAARFFYNYYREERSYDADRDYVRHVENGDDHLLIRYPAQFVSKLHWILLGMAEMAEIYDVHERWTD